MIKKEHMGAIRVNLFKRFLKPNNTANEIEENTESNPPSHNTDISITFKIYGNEHTIHDVINIDKEALNRRSTVNEVKDFLEKNYQVYENKLRFFYDSTYVFDSYTKENERIILQVVFK